MKDMDSRLVDKVLKNQSSFDETRAVVKWMKTKEGQAYLNDCLSKRFSSGYYDESQTIPSEKMKGRLFQALFRRSLFTWKWISAAAALILLVTGLAIYTVSHPLFEEEETAWTTVIIPYGKRGHVTLPDGTSVYLSPGSRLKHPTRFEVKERQVNLSGEGYFDVISNPNHPFIVDVGNLKVKVTGTSFSIMAFGTNSKVRLKLDKGHVCILHDNTKTDIAPGEYMVYDKSTHKMTVSREEGTYYADWKTGIYHFNDAPLQTILYVLERNYNANFHIKDSCVKAYHYTMSLSNIPLPEVLSNMELSAPICFSKEKNAYIVKMK